MREPSSLVAALVEILALLGVAVPTRPFFLAPAEEGLILVENDRAFLVRLVPPKVRSGPPGGSASPKLVRLQVPGARTPQFVSLAMEADEREPVAPRFEWKVAPVPSGHRVFFHDAIFSSLSEAAAVEPLVRAGRREIHAAVRAGLQSPLERLPTITGGAREQASALVAALAASRKASAPVVAALDKAVARYAKSPFAPYLLSMREAVKSAPPFRLSPESLVPVLERLQSVESHESARLEYERLLESAAVAVPLPPP